jgi:hypothetical protein
MNFNKKFFNWSAWITLLITYVLPYQSTDGFVTKFGYPFPFLTVYKTSTGRSLLMSQNLNVFILAINILIVYFVISFVNAQLAKAKLNRAMNDTKTLK